MRTIKHWAGYGTVKAGTVKDGSCRLHVRVEGLHERGLVQEDPYTLYNWIVKRFDRTVPDYLTWIRSRPLIYCEEDFNATVDICHYYFHY